ncbi:MAG: HEAT repeat domain-containing protein [Polyangiaceae bacterium]
MSAVGRDSFEEVRQLPEEELRQLLSAGSSIQRVWAAWALGLRQGAQFAPEAGAQLAAEPDPGVRRHLAVILAGAGDRDAVQALAEHDPAEVVRTSALRLRLQMSTGAERARVIEGLISVATSGRSESLRCEVLRILSTIPRELSAKSLEPCLADPVEAVRRASLDVLFLMRSEEATLSLIAHSAREPAAHLQREIWLRLCDMGRAPQVIDRLAKAPSTLLAAMHVWHGAKRKLRWAELAGAAALELGMIDLVLFELIDDAKTLPLAYLCERALLGLRTTEPSGEAERACAGVGYWARQTLSEIGIQRGALDLNHDQQQALWWMLGELKREEQGLEAECLDDPDDEYLFEQLDYVVKCKTGLTELLGLTADEQE